MSIYTSSKAKPTTAELVATDIGALSWINNAYIFFGLSLPN
jgi:hypothetical protein